MARTCQLLGKKTTSGQNRPFSMKATKRTFKPNLFTRKVLNPITGRVERMKLSAKAIKTLKKWSKLGAEEIEQKTKGTASVAGEGKHVKKEKKLTPKQKKEEAAKKEAEALGKVEKTEEKK